MGRPNKSDPAAVLEMQTAKWYQIEIGVRYTLHLHPRFGCAIP